jgi:Ca2+-binding EF-hand superfamily protein
MDAAQAASVQSMMASLDVNGDGVISYDEWMMAAAQKRLDAKEERLYQAFRQFDLDGDGHITAEEMKLVLAKNDDNEIAQLIREVDKDGDGTVDYEEFLAMWYEKNNIKGPELDD